jgi:hypothetical protein
MEEAPNSPLSHVDPCGATAFFILLAMAFGLILPKLGIG